MFGKLSFVFVGMLFFLALGSTSCTKRYKIIGNVPEIEDGTLLYLRIVGRPSRDIDSTYVQNGRFEFSGTTGEKPEWAVIDVKGRWGTLCNLYLENGSINVEGKTAYTAVASGTETNEQYNIFRQKICVYNDTLYGLHTAAAIAEGSLEKANLKKQIALCQQKMSEREIEFLKTYPASPISVRILSSARSSKTGRQLNEMISLLDSNLQQEEEVVRIKAYADQLEKTEVGALAPDFTLATINGNEFSLSKERGKYLLLDFWASWCSPCRASFPTIAEIHRKYAGKPFSVVGISLDRNTDAWKKALKEEGCTWLQVCDSSGNVAEQYAVSAIPLLLLVGPDGKIIGRFRPNEIDEKLEQLFPQ